ncbi:hypothetical protein Bca101_091513 [Brassica carinata]
MVLWHFHHQSAVITLTKPTLFRYLELMVPFLLLLSFTAANAPTGQFTVRLKLTLEKSWDYDQHFHANRILDRKRKDNSFKTGKNNDNRSYDY